MKVYTLSKDVGDKPGPRLVLHLQNTDGQGIARLVMSPDQALAVKNDIDSLLQDHADLHAWGEAEKYKELFVPIPVVES